MSQSIFLKICYDYIKDNSYINFDYGNHIRIVWSCNNATKAHNVSYIPLKNIDNGLPVAKTIIKYNCNNSVENDEEEEEKEPIYNEFTEHKQILIMMKMLLTLND